MLSSIIQGAALVGTLMFTTHPATLPQTPIQVTTERVHAVKNGESLSQIADAYYHNPSAWPSLAKENPQITDVNNIEKGMVVKIPIVPTVFDAPITTPAVTPEHDSIELQASPALTEAIPTAIPQAKADRPLAETVAPVTFKPGATGPLSAAQIDFLGHCEAGMAPDRNSGNGYYGAFQFSYGTWKSMGTGYERADLAPLDVQIDAVQRLLQRSSIYTQFPGCSRKMHAAGLL